MSSKQSESFISMTGISSIRTSSQTAGWGVFGFGALYMLLMGWLASWWVVPAIRQAGLESLPGISFFFVWQLAAPVGAFLVAIGAAFVAQVEGPRKAIIIGGSLVVTIWLVVSMGAFKQVVPPIFGIGGGLISLAFLGSLFDWARSR